MGGYVKGNAKTGYSNDVWRTFDQGRTWAVMTESAGWEPRAGAASTGVTGVVTGVVPTTSSSYASQSITKDNFVDFVDAVWLMGGAGLGTCYNDVWLSVDGGKQWAPGGSVGSGIRGNMNIAKAPWLARRDHTLVQLEGGDLLLMGGYDCGAILAPGQDARLFNDVWRLVGAAAAARQAVSGAV